MSGQKRVAPFAGSGARVVLACLLLVAACSRSSAPQPTGAARSPSASAAPSAAPLAESVPPPPSEAAVFADSRKLSPRCQALRTSNERMYEESRKRLGAKPVCGINLQVDKLGCVTLENGVTWGYRLVGATSALPSPAATEYWSCLSKWRLELVREDQVGKKGVVRGGELSFANVYYDEDTSVELEGLSDYDTDGEPELLRSVYRKAHEGDPHDDTQVLTYRAGGVEAYAPSRGVSFGAGKDVDGDGLLDLTSTGPYGAISAQTDIGSRYGVAPALFAHQAQRDGTFSMLTPAAMAYTKAQCPRGPMPEFVPEDINSESELARALICARLWGTEAKQIEARFRKVCPTSYEQHERDYHARSRANEPAEPSEDERIRETELAAASRPCREWVLELARVKPPFSLAQGRQ